MDFNFLAAANSITNKYFNQDTVYKVAENGGLDDSARQKFGDEFEQAYDSMMAARALNSSMRDSYELTHQEDLQSHASRLGYSIDNRIIDMLGIQLSDSMNENVTSAINNAIESL